MIIWCVIALCIVVSFVFYGIEAGVLSVNRTRLRHEAREGVEPAIELDAMLQELERLMITVLIVNSTANMLAITLLFETFQLQLGLNGAVWAILLLAPVFILLLEFLPKAIFQRFPYRALVRLARVLRWVHMILRPLVSVGVFVSKLFMGGGGGAGRRVIPAGEIRRQLHIAERNGTIGPQAREFSMAVLDFRFRRLQDVVRPMEDVVVVSPECSVERVIELFRDKGYERLPVQDAEGKVLGIVNAFDLLLEGTTKGRVQSHLRRMVTVGREATPYEVVERLRGLRQSLALVENNDGSPFGVVALEDLVRMMLVPDTANASAA